MQKQWSSSKYEGSINCFNCSQIFGKDTLWTSLFVTVTVEDKVFQQVGWGLGVFAVKKEIQKNRNSGEQYLNRLLYGEPQKISL